MGTVAVVIQWYGSERLTPEWLRKIFARTLLALIVTFIALTIVHIMVVVTMPIENGDTLSFLVSADQTNHLVLKTSLTLPAFSSFQPTRQALSHSGATGRFASPRSHWSSPI